MASSDLDGLCVAVGALLETVSGIGKVSTRPGGVPTWRERLRPLQAYWEIDVVSAREEHSSFARNVDETVMVRVEGFMPFSYSGPNSAETWRDLLRAVKDRLRANRTVSGAVSDSELPQLVLNERVAFEDGRQEPLCHHAVIEWAIIGEFDYTTS